MKKYVLSLISLFLLNACCTDKPPVVVQSHCPTVILNDAELKTVRDIDRHRIIWKKAYEGCLE